ncbi:hypothetical protein BKA65DRAFT_553234 [Rhexocercosporidium sp. MPI-PUGE-AT-0058]|nr:hypothetical protein BKA65DRAFT_553234 [Rhexocercosporidium sp. MPI-PUGE-AT-0058]
MADSPPQSPPIAVQDAAAVIEPDFIDNSESDSAYAKSLQTFTTSIGESVFNYKYENGRRYHAFHDGEYPLPNDEKEQERLDLLHHIFKLMLGGALYVAPLP